MDLCFYHSADLDGKCSGALIKMQYPDCSMIGIDYGLPFPWELIKTKDREPKKKVVMVDFSLQPFSHMMKLDSMCNLFWIDHHESAIQEAVKRGFTPPGRRYVGKAACELVWNYIAESHPELPSSPCPKSVEYLSRYDVGDFSDRKTLYFQYGLRAQSSNPSPNNKAFWDQVIFGGSSYIDRTVDQGQTIVCFLQAEMKKYIDSCSFEVDFQGYRCLGVNKNFPSDLLLSPGLWDGDKYDILLTFGFKYGKWHVLMYSPDSGVDVSLIAKKYGGGGHEHAAGFQSACVPPFVPWVPIVKENGE